MTKNIFTIEDYPITSLKIGNQIDFGNDIIYQVDKSHLNLIQKGEGRSNDLIFRTLGLNNPETKAQLVYMTYGYNAPGQFPSYTSLKDGIKMINTLFKCINPNIDKKEDRKTKVLIDETDQYTDYTIGSTKIRLYDSPLVIVKKTKDDNKEQPRAVKKTGRTTPRGWGLVTP
jgi:hypothetical protein